MNVFKKTYYFFYKKIYKVAMRFINIPVPTLYNGENCILKVKDILKEKNINQIFLVTDNALFSLGLINQIIKSLEESGVKVTLFKDVVPNPTIDNIEEGLCLFTSSSSKAIIAFGGGSVIDTAKAIGARYVNPKKKIPDLKGNLKVKKKLPYLIAIPTTAGTGSEATLASVVSNRLTHEKYPINDPKLVPDVAFLDPNLTLKLPSNITSTTGMDALTHAVEAYIGKANTKNTKKWALEAIKLIYENLKECFANPTNIKSRENMLKASYLAGLAFTRAFVGNVHAIAHTLGGFYNTPHGLANAVILPVVLEKYGESVYKPLSEIADFIKPFNVETTKKQKAEWFISWVKEMNNNMGIPSCFANLIKEEDLPLMIARADKEANPLYPVPKVFSYKEFEDIYLKISN